MSNVPNNDDFFLAEYNRLVEIENEDWGPDEEDDWYHLSCAMTHRLAAILDNSAQIR